MKHQELKQAWENGAKIEYSRGDFWIQVDHPKWKDGIEYRIAPVVIIEPATHTPAPWLMVKDEYSDDYQIPDVIFADREGNVSISEANARLISAAPDLLEAAILVLKWYEAEHDHTKVPDFYERAAMCLESESAIRSAIAKATGK